MPSDSLVFSMGQDSEEKVSEPRGFHVRRILWQLLQVFLEHHQDSLVTRLSFLRFVEFGFGGIQVGPLHQLVQVVGERDPF